MSPMSSWGDILTEQLGGDILMDQQQIPERSLTMTLSRGQHRAPEQGSRGNDLALPRPPQGGPDHVRTDWFRPCPDPVDGSDSVPARAAVDRDGPGAPARGGAGLRRRVGDAEL